MTVPPPPAPRPLRVLVLGVGNACRGDDAVGLVVARRLQEDPLDGVTIVPTAGEGTALLALWQDADAVVLVDAVCTGASPGTLHRFAGGTQPLPAVLSRASTHAFGVAEAIELARALQQLPPAFVVYGVEGVTFEMGADLSAAVVAVVPQVIAQVRQEVLGLIDSSSHHGPLRGLSRPGTPINSSLAEPVRPDSLPLEGEGAPLHWRPPADTVAGNSPDGPTPTPSRQGRGGGETRCGPRCSSEVNRRA
jgi:hydrogenase maturation protease